MSSRQIGHSVQAFRTDNGTEFMVLKNYFKEQGILHQTSCVDTPQQNRRVERKHRHILNVARACLFQARLPTTFWGESILTAAHLINRTPTRVLNGKSPYEMLHGSPPSYDMLCVFGCLAYAHRRHRDKDKFGDCSRRCLFVGYPHEKKGWYLYDVETNEFFISRDVVFLEEEFLGITSQDHPQVSQLEFATDEWFLPVDAPASSTPVTVPTASDPALPISTPSTSTTPTMPNTPKPSPIVPDSYSNNTLPATPETPQPATETSNPTTPLLQSLRLQTSQDSHLLNLIHYLPLHNMYLLLQDYLNCLVAVIVRSNHMY